MQNKQQFRQHLYQNWADVNRRIISVLKAKCDQNKCDSN